MTLLEAFTDPMLFQACKHDLGSSPEQYAVDQTNSMSNYELLEALSEALEKVIDHYQGLPV